MCLQCPLGTFSDGGLPSCAPCTSGTYTDVKGTVNCTLCPEGTLAASSLAPSVITSVSPLPLQQHRRFDFDRRVRVLPQRIAHRSPRPLFRVLHPSHRPRARVNPSTPRVPTGLRSSTSIDRRHHTLSLVECSPRSVSRDRAHSSRETPRAEPPRVARASSSCRDAASTSRASKNRMPIGKGAQRARVSSAA